MLDEEIVFKGIDRNDALQFMSAIRKKALEKGKQRDYEWMADFASGCMEGEAIDWYESLDVEVQQDWTHLSRELRGHWAQAAHEGAPASAIAAAGQGRLPTRLSGVVKVISKRGTDYLSRTLTAGASWEGCIQITDKLDDAVRVTFQRSDGIHEVRFESDFSGYPLLGFHFNNPVIDLYAESDLWAYLTPYQVTSTGSILMPQNHWSGSGGHRVAASQWRVEEDGIMRPYVLDDYIHTSKEVDVMLDLKSGSPFIAHNLPRLLKYVENINARLVFESC